ncbi:hypothetical protein CBL_13856 [Carabus blaptoides fortunei]
MSVLVGTRYSGLLSRISHPYLVHSVAFMATDMSRAPSFTDVLVPTPLAISGSYRRWIKSDHVPKLDLTTRSGGTNVNIQPSVEQGFWVEGGGRTLLNKKRRQNEEDTDKPWGNAVSRRRTVLLAALASCSTPGPKSHSHLHIAPVCHRANDLNAYHKKIIDTNTDQYMSPSRLRLGHYSQIMCEPQREALMLTTVIGVPHSKHCVVVQLWYDSSKKRRTGDTKEKRLEAFCLQRYVPFPIDLPTATVVVNEL